MMMRFTQLCALASVAMALAAAPAVAEQMMPPGPSPESGLAGVWRVIDAQAAPWVKPHRLTKDEAPLLEYAVAFKDNKVEGPAPLACSAATYSSGVTYSKDWFVGKLADDASGAKAAALHISQPTTFRVICGSKARDYYVDETADIIMAEGDVIYTLERPTGMEPGQYLPGYSGPSFDCTQAATAGERLICRDAALSKTDSKLGAAFEALRKAETAASFATVQAGERAWVAYVMKSCHASDAMPDDIGDRNSMIECLNTEYTDRAALMDGLSVARSRASVLEPRMRFRTRNHPATEESDIYPFMTGGGEAAAFNTFVSQVLKLDRWRMDDKKLFRYGNDVNDMKLHAHRSYSPVRFDGRIVSLRIGTSDFVGGHDEEYGQTGLTYDIAAAKRVTLDDVFVDLKASRAFVKAYCLKDLKERVEGDEKPADLDLSSIDATIASGDSWLWGTDKATVMFTIFMNSGMPSEPYDVEIPYAVLKKFMKPGAAVLVGGK